MAAETIHILEDQNLLARLYEAARAERRCQIAGLVYLAEVEKRRLHLKIGYKSLFEFCVERLKWSEGSVYRRIQVARKGTQCPQLLEAVRQQRVTLTVASLIAPRITPVNTEVTLRRFEGKTRREAEDLLAKLGHAEAKRKTESIRLVAGGSSPRCASAQNDGDAPAARKDVDTSLMPSERGSSPRFASAQNDGDALEEIFSFRFTGNRRLRDKVMRAKEVMASKIKSTDLDAVVEAALDCLLDKHDPKRLEQRLAKRDAAKSIEVPIQNVVCPTRSPSAPLERFVFQKAGHRCEWTAEGRRCTATTFLEIDHIVSFAKGGKTTASNLQVLCSEHNRLKARLEFGDHKIDRAIRLARLRPGEVGQARWG